MQESRACYKTQECTEEEQLYFEQDGNQGAVQIRLKEEKASNLEGN
jgi:hypothetical protein